MSAGHWAGHWAGFSLERQVAEVRPTPLHLQQARPPPPQRALPSFHVLWAHSLDLSPDRALRSDPSKVGSQATAGTRSREPLCPP